MAGVLNFPKQKVSTSLKTKDWFKKNVDYGIASVLYDNTNDYHIYKDMVRWKNLYYDIIDNNEVIKELNPMNIKSGNMPYLNKNYNIINSKLNLLEGEEINRRFEYSVVSKSTDANNKFLENEMNDVMQAVYKFLQDNSKDEKELQSEIQKISKYYKYSYKDLNEVTGGKLLGYIYQKEELKEKFLYGFRDLNRYGREIYKFEVIGKDLAIGNANPLNTFYYSNKESTKIEDADCIVEISYETIGRIVDIYYDKLSSSDLDKLEGFGSERSTTGRQMTPRMQMTDMISSKYAVQEQLEKLGFRDINGNSVDQILDYFQPVNDDGLIRVAKVRWKSRKKIGVLTYYEEGISKERYVSEYYKPNEDLGESVRWIWINEACTGDLIHSDIYVNCEISPFQIRNFNNPSKCFLGYVGTDIHDSLIGRTEALQYRYNYYIKKLEMIINKYKGPIYELDISKKPDDWTTPQWMYYADIIGYLVVDSFKQGDEGLAANKLAGTFNTTGKVLQGTVDNIIQEILAMLQYLEKQVGKITGVTDQREGEISDRETATSTERSVKQSTSITENRFFVHNNTKKRVLQYALDILKQIFSTDDNVTINYILNDTEKIFLKFNGKDFASQDQDVFVSDSNNDAEIRSIVKNLSQAYVQNGASMLTPINILRSNSITEMIKKIEVAEQQLKDEEAEKEKAANEANERIKQMEIDDKNAERELEKYKIDSDYDKAIDVQKLKNSGDTSNTDDIDNRKLDLENRKLDEAKRHNQATEKISNTKKGI